MTASESLFVELESTFKNGSHEKRAECLRRITDLFLSSGYGLNEDQIAIFDDVICYLIKAIETKALVELSKRLAPLTNAPIEVIRRLAHNDEIVVAEPVLSQSTRLPLDDLVTIAATKGQEHLRAISKRAELHSSVTDVLVSRGDVEVLHRISANAGTRFSDPGLAQLVLHAESDAQLAEHIVIRRDLPRHLLRQLVSKASTTVQSRLLAVALPENKDEIQQVFATASEAVKSELGAPRNYT